MKKYLFLLISAITVFTSCQSNTSEQNTADNAAIDTNIVPSAPQECYTYINNRDTASLTIMTSGNITTGELSYNLYEKDKNKGIIKGEMRGDTLVAEYTFSSEGTESIRQVAFLKKGTQLLEGYGQVEEKDGKMHFKDLRTLSFGKAIVFTKTDCN